MYFSYNEKTKTAVVPLKVKAGAKESTIHGFVDINRTHILKISVKAAPEDGKANNAIIKMFADKWNLRQTQLEIIKGSSGSSKLLAIKDVDRSVILEVASNFKDLRKQE